MQLRQPQLVALRQELVDPLPRRMELEPVAGVRGDERAPAAVLLDAPAVPLGPQAVPPAALGGRLDLVLVEHEAEMVDAGRRPLARLDHDVDRALLELGQPEL